MRMPFVMGRGGYGVQYPHGTRKALPVLQYRLAGAGACDDRDRHATDLDVRQDALDLARPGAGRIRDVPPCRGISRIGSGLGERVLEPVGLADPTLIPPYWNFLWDSNPLTYYSSRWSSGSPSKSSMAEEADAGAVCRFGPTSSRSLPPTRFLTVAAQTITNGVCRRGCLA